MDDPDVQNFLSMSEKRNECKTGTHMRALANFDIKKLRVIPGTTWAIILEYVGLTTDEPHEIKWNISNPENDPVNVSKPKGEPQPRFQMFCYSIGEGLDAGEWMVVTQSAKFNGWKDMDPSLIPQFEEGSREEVVRQLLAEQGT